MERRKRQSITDDEFARQGKEARRTPEHLPADLGDVWISRVNAPDMPLRLARQRYADATGRQQRAAFLLAIVRAERRLAVQYAPHYTWQVLNGAEAALEGAEHQAYNAAVARGE